MNTTLTGWPGFLRASLLISCLSLGLQADAAPPPGVAAELERLQGVWKGVALTRRTTDGSWVPSADSITITITGDSFHFHRDTNFWFRTTIVLSPGTLPRQLRATIRENAPSQGDNAIGKVVAAIYRIEGGTLTLAARGDGSDETPAGFEEENVTRYELRKSSPAEKVSPSPLRPRIGE